jgi:low temperature requirement protein LtrA
MMVLGLVLSTSVPEAFGDRALLFVAAYVTMQIGRALFTIASMIRFEPANALNVTRLTIWFCVSAIFWFAGAAAEETWWRIGLWAVAIAIEYLGPVSRYWVPGLRSSYIGGIPIRGAHIAERAGLFVIIAIGESIIVTGAAFTENPIEAASILAFLASVTGSILLWLLYFSRAEAGGARYIRRHDNPSLVAANSYTYLHVVLVGGIVLVAVADELVLSHPTEPARLITIALVYGAPIVYLVGNLVFKRSIGAPWLKSHLVGTAVLLALGALFLTPLVSLSALAHTWIANAVLVGVVIGEEIDFRTERRKRRAARDSLARS